MTNYVSGMPGQQPWMAAPQVPVGCPPGLEYLTMIDQVLAHQVVELLQAFTGWETQNKYAIKNSMGQQIYYAFEDTDLCMRMCCGPARGFTIHIVNNFNQVQYNTIFKCCFMTIIKGSVKNQSPVQMLCWLLLVRWCL
jgi:hypothetical protein